MLTDDFNIFQTFDRNEPLDKCKDILNQYKNKVLKWGGTSRVSFDATKEHMIVMHPSENHGCSYKLLGCMIDVDLRMHSLSLIHI